jgi:hypothetical protein
MSRFLVIFAAVSALAGCANPRYDSDAPGAQAPGDAGTVQESTARARRDGAAGSGSTAQPE